MFIFYLSKSLDFIDESCFLTISINFFNVMHNSWHLGLSIL